MSHNTIKSHEWRALINTPVPILLTAIEYMAEGAQIYEQDGGTYPQVEFSISLAMDRMKESTESTEATEATLSEEEIRHNESPKSRQRRIRESWLKKFETDQTKVNDTRRGRLAARRAKRNKKNRDAIR